MERPTPPKPVRSLLVCSDKPGRICMLRMSNQIPSWIDPLVVGLVTLVVFVGVLKTPFSMVDDYLMLVNNPMLDPPTWAGFKYQLTTPQYHLYSPVTYGLLYVLGTIAGPGTSMSPVPFKLASWFLHAMTAVAAWGVIRQFCSNRLASIVGALVVGIHPLQVESVAWTTGLKDVLCGLLSFISIGLTLHWIRTGKRRFWQMSILGCGLAVLSKPSATVLPLILVFIDVVLRQSSPKDRFRRWWPWLAIGLFSAIITLQVQTAEGVKPAPLWSRPFIAGDSYAFYLQKLVCPIGLAVDYTRTPDQVVKTGEVYWKWIIPTLVFGGLFLTGNRRIWIACVLFIAPILPVSGLVSFDMQFYTTVTDHYVYTSLLGVGLLVSMLLERHRFLIVMGIVILGIGSWMTVSRLTVWQDMRKLAWDTIAKYPRSRLVWESIPAMELVNGRFREAELLCYRALQLRPSELVYDTLADALYRQGRFEQAAIAARKALSMPNNIGVNRVKQILALAAKVNDDELARLAVLKWLDLEPDHPGARSLLKDINASIVRKKLSTRPSHND